MGHSVGNDTLAASAAALYGFGGFKTLIVMSYLVDPASSHMLVFKTKPCKSKYKQFIQRNCRWLIKTVIVYLMDKSTWIPVGIPELIHARSPDSRRDVFVRLNTNAFRGFSDL